MCIKDWIISTFPPLSKLTPSLIKVTDTHGRFCPSLTDISGPGSVVGVATGYGLDGPGVESRWGARYSAPVQTGTEAHPASCTMGTGSFPGGKERPRLDADPSPLLVPWFKKE